MEIHVTIYNVFETWVTWHSQGRAEQVNSVTLWLISNSFQQVSRCNVVMFSIVCHGETTDKHIFVWSIIMHLFSVLQITLTQIETAYAKYKCKMWVNIGCSRCYFKVLFASAFPQQLNFFWTWEQRHPRNCHLELYHFQLTLKQDYTICSLSWMQGRRRPRGAGEQARTGGHFDKKFILQHEVITLSQFASMVVSVKYKLCRSIIREKNILNKRFALVDALTLTLFMSNFGIVSPGRCKGRAFLCPRAAPSGGSIGGGHRGHVPPPPQVPGKKLFSLFFVRQN